MKVVARLGTPRPLLVDFLDDKLRRLDGFHRDGEAATEIDRASISSKFSHD
jgi:hypothetical protein